MAKRRVKRKSVAMVIHKTRHPKKAAFLAAFAETGNVSSASVVSGIARHSHYDWLDADPEYASKFDEAKEKAVAKLEDEARRRAIQGVKKVVTHQGKVVMVPVDKDGNVVPEDSPKFVGMVPLLEHQYSDTLLIFLMKGADPQKYAQFERPTAMTLIQNNIQAGPEEVTLTIPPPKVIGRIEREPEVQSEPGT